ncbi:hypothetical protein MYK68_16030 [Gordonia sp. PP30]|uniref:hypothetical protein n=1 Tax=Gordonia sp. PP30 TaxID=2935861 RepID=UPI001FFE9AAC|nr:hypothetical protein [Gordonia sp. PP30]UQE74220.1 hypothetical protein MYK68_16030 [Gordonia sp. PP30]
MTLDDDARRRAAAQRAHEIAGCGVCDSDGWVTGRQTSRDGITRDAAWRCDHTDRPLPHGFTPDGGVR